MKVSEEWMVLWSEKPRVCIAQDLWEAVEAGMLSEGHQGGGIFRKEGKIAHFWCWIRKYLQMYRKKHAGQK